MTKPKEGKIVRIYGTDEVVRAFWEMEEVLTFTKTLNY